MKIEKTLSSFQALKGRMFIPKLSLEQRHFWVYIRNLGSNRRVSNPRCLANNNLYDCAYAVIKHDRIVFDLIRPGGAYTGEGKLKNGKLELKTNYFYRGINVDYELSGRKVD